MELDEFMLNKLILEKNQLVENVIALEKRLDENVLARENKRLKDEFMLNKLILEKNQCEKLHMALTSEKIKITYAFGVKVTSS